MNASEQKELRIEIEDYFLDFWESTKRFIVIDNYFLMNDHGLFFRNDEINKNFIIDDLNKTITINKSKLRKRWKELRSQNKFTNKLSANKINHNHCYGHLIQKFFTHKIRFYFEESMLNYKVYEQIFESVIISEFWDNISNFNEELCHYRSQFEKYCTNICNLCEKQ